MSDFYIYLKVEPYLAEWLTDTFGDPIEIIRDSPESHLLKRFLVKLPTGVQPDTCISEEFNVRVRIPCFKEKDPRTYNHLKPIAKKALVDSFESLFVKNMWSEIGKLDNCNCSITTVIYAWLEKHNMSEEHWEAIRQRYYRLRKKYFKEKELKIA